MLEGVNMKRLDTKELERITGGFSTWAALGIVSAVLFLSGVFGGIVHPKSCGEWHRSKRIQQEI